MPKIFISYRRTDAIDAVRALYFQLRLRFGFNQVFMDVSAISAGEVWSNRLEQAISDATVVLIVIGPNWLKAADKFGRRRIDIKSDWVRREVQYALDAQKIVIPLLIGGEVQLPPLEALPAPLKGIAQHQQHILSNERWEDDVQSLANRFVTNYGFGLVDQTVVYPLPEMANEIPLGEKQLLNALSTLPNWEPVESYIPRDYPKSRHELRRGFRFSKFRYAIAFLHELVGPLDLLDHHPRIENQWRTVFIYFTTWDVGNKLTALDIRAAHLVDEVYKEFCIRNN